MPTARMLQSWTTPRNVGVRESQDHMLGWAKLGPLLVGLGQSVSPKKSAESSVSSLQETQPEPEPQEGTYCLCWGQQK